MNRNRSFFARRQRTTPVARRSRSSVSGLLGVIVLIWLVVGAVAAWQRDYFDSAPTNCAGTGTIALTVVAGPLNYLGLNPKVTDCNMPDMPQPSQ